MCVYVYEDDLLGVERKKGGGKGRGSIGTDRVHECRQGDGSIDVEWATMVKRAFCE